MPELPEVETTLNGIKDHVLNQKVCAVVIRHHGLRWPIDKALPQLLLNQKVKALRRRGKYLLFEFSAGTLILHLGMSGSLCIVTAETVAEKHDHFDLVLANHKILRLNDPRRFGAVLWTAKDPASHFLLKHLGPEPLTPEFNGHYLLSKAQQRKIAVKSFIMDSKIVVGVGNIYATESLFAAKIYPSKPAGKITLAAYERLAKEIKKVLRAAIIQGGTTLKDFYHSEGKQGYFSVRLQVYGKKNQPCPNCKKPLSEMRLNQRSTVFCSYCQR